MVLPSQSTHTPVAAGRATSRNHTRDSRLSAFFLCAGLVVLFVGALPILLVPLQHDDLVFLLADNAGSSSYADIMESKFQQLIDLGRTNFLSSIGAGTHHYVIWHVGTNTGLSLQAVERTLFMFWLTSAVLAGTYFATSAFGHRLAGPPRLRFATAFLVVASVVGLTLQSHSRWSNDPAVSYPAWGFGSAAIAFLYLGALVHAISAARIRLRDVAGLTIAGLVAVFWYEMNWVLLPVATLMLLWVISQAPRNERRAHLVTLVAGVGIPALALVVVRAYLLAHATQSYSGTQPHFGSDSLYRARTWDLRVTSSRGMAPIGCRDSPSRHHVVRVAAGWRSSAADRPRHDFVARRGVTGDSDSRPT